MSIRRRERETLRDLGRRVAEIAADPVQEEKAAAWRRHNALAAGRPRVLLFPEGSWRELLPPERLVCEDPAARWYERMLRQRIYTWEHLRDDNVISGALPSPVVCRNSGWGIEPQQTRPEEPTGAAHFDPVICSEADAEKIRVPRVTVDHEATERHFRRVSEWFDGVLPVVKQGNTHFGFAVIDLFARWRGLDQLFLDMVDRPAWLHGVLDRLTTGMLTMLDDLEAGGALSLNNGAHYCGSGGVGFTDELPAADFDGERVRPEDMWGFATTQIFSEVSPSMHEEFALRYEKRWLSRFGLNAYGCCEPLHHKLEGVFEIPRLRRLSMSPWVDVSVAAERIGNRCIFSRKPNPAPLAAPTWEPEAVRRELRDDLERTRGCVVELVMKDTHTCLNEPERMSDWVRIALEEAEDMGG